MPNLNFAELIFLCARWFKVARVSQRQRETRLRCSYLVIARNRELAYQALDTRRQVSRQHLRDQRPEARPRMSNRKVSTNGSHSQRAIGA